MKTEGPDCDWCGCSGSDGDLDVYSVAGDFVCELCREDCNRVATPAATGTGVEEWEVRPCLRHFDPHDGTEFVESYETMDDAEDASYEGTGAIFWAVYAVMRREYHTSVITPSIHIADFDSPRDAAEFVQAMAGRKPK